MIKFKVGDVVRLKNGDKTRSYVVPDGTRAVVTDVSDYPTHFKVEWLPYGLQGNGSYRCEDFELVTEDIELVKDEDRLPDWRPGDTLVLRHKTRGFKAPNGALATVGPKGVYISGHGKKAPAVQVLWSPAWRTTQQDGEYEVENFEVFARADDDDADRWNARALRAEYRERLQTLTFQELPQFIHDVLSERIEVEQINAVTGLISSATHRALRDKIKKEA